MSGGRTPAAPSVTWADAWQASAVLEQYLRGLDGPKAWSGVSHVHAIHTILADRLRPETGANTRGDGR